MPKGKILVTVLNWGLGHATRCIPIIQELLQNDFQPILASDGQALAFLRKEFPQLAFYELTTLKIKYSSRSAFNQFYLLGKSFAWDKQLQKDQSLINAIQHQENLAGIISDSRPYCYHTDVPSVYVTHQLQVKSGLFSAMTTAVHRRLMSRFDECWVPDFAPPHSVCGSMSQWEKAKLPIRYLGIVSDLQSEDVAQTYDYAAILSGAEPERSKLAHQMINSFQHLKGKKIIITGSSATTNRQLSEDFTLKGLAQRTEVQTILNRAQTIVARGGYSTIMDLIELKKTALLIPTPGQTEQLYLTNHLRKLDYFDKVTQKKLSAERILQFEEQQAKLNYIAFSGFNFGKVFRLFEGK